MKICLAASSGGHFEQIMMVSSLIDEYEGFIITEKTSYDVDSKYKTYRIKQVNRKEKAFIIKELYNGILSLRIFLKEKPDVIICTGALAMLPICIIAKLFKRKLVFIESFAKITSPTKTGKFLYKYADRFYIQWEELYKFYPNAIYKGGIY